MRITIQQKGQESVSLNINEKSQEGLIYGALTAAVWVGLGTLLNTVNSLGTYDTHR